MTTGRSKIHNLAMMAKHKQFAVTHSPANKCSSIMVMYRDNNRIEPLRGYTVRS